MPVSLIVPLGEGHNVQREDHWRWLRARYEWHHDFEVVEGRCDHEHWSKAAAVADAATRATGDVWVVLDGDLWVEPWALREAVVLAAGGAAPWVVPGHNVYRLSSGATAEVCRGDPCGLVEFPTAHGQLDHAGYTAAMPYRLFAGGGVLVLRREAYETAGGFDPRFVGWGGEDTSLAAALDTLAGPHVRLTGRCWHLWHRYPKSRVKLGRMMPANDRLNRRYLRAAGDAAAMSSLIEERD